MLNSQGTVPFRNLNSKKTPIVSFEYCQFETTEKTQLNSNKKANGDVISEDYDSFKPMYQYYKHD